MFKWFKRKKDVATKATDPPTTQPVAATPTEPRLPKEEYQRVALIATAIAAGDHPESTFHIKHIQKLKSRTGLPMTFEEKDRVIAIASAILAGDRPDSQFRVKSVIKLK